MTKKYERDLRKHRKQIETPSSTSNQVLEKWAQRTEKSQDLKA